jgi:hypothetical protein
LKLFGKISIASEIKMREFIDLYDETDNPSRLMLDNFNIILTSVSKLHRCILLFCETLKLMQKNVKSRVEISNRNVVVNLWKIASNTEIKINEYLQSYDFEIDPDDLIIGENWKINENERKLAEKCVDSLGSLNIDKMTCIEYLMSNDVEEMIEDSEKEEDKEEDDEYSDEEEEYEENLFIMRDPDEISPRKKRKLK